MALSATIGNPEEVTGWLQDVKTLQQQQDLQAGIVRPAASYTVRLIQHSERFADLRCYRYDPSSQQSKDWEDQAGREMKPQDQNGRNQRGPEQPEAFDQALHRMHPCAVLEAERLQTDSFPPELSLEPSDCLKLYDSMYSALANDHDNLWTFAAQQALSLLAPDAYFTPGAAILRQQVRQWEAALKAELVRWACADSRLGLQAVHQALQQLKAASDWRLNPTQAVSRRVEIDDFNIMVKGLDQKGMLPAIAFSFDRGNCIRLAGATPLPSNVTDTTSPMHIVRTYICHICSDNLYWSGNMSD